jgi:hypothetical protein
MSKDEIAYFPLTSDSGRKPLSARVLSTDRESCDFCRLHVRRDTFLDAISHRSLGSSSNSGTEIKLVVPGDIVFRKETAVHRTLFARIKVLLKRMGRTSNVD